MKIQASAKMPEEGRDYQDLKRYIRARHPGAKVRESEAQPPYKVLYLTTKNPGNRYGSKEKA